ncbi:MAG TPA: ribose-5-phosphate isomerase [Candidatus Kaiserbacteria bacterium]|nr:ribose-5-phosphate isomerase [Candidatus Kaiserbacteria bacterium]
MFVYFASDHAGFPLKNSLAEFLRGMGYGVEDMGAHDFSPEDDYPDFIMPCAQKVAQESGSGAGAKEHSRAEGARVFGVIIGGSGQGEAMAANRVKGVRAAVFYGGAHALGAIDENGTAPSDELDIVRLSRLHNDANILSFGARFVSEDLAQKALLIFLKTQFSDTARHARRIAKY